MTKFEDELRSAVEDLQNNVCGRGLISDYSDIRLETVTQVAVLLLEILPELRGMVWQPIESAPRDGTYILASANGNLPYVCNFSTIYEDWCLVTPNRDTVNPTHWMPIPSSTLSEKLKKAGLI